MVARPCTAIPLPPHHFSNVHSLIEPEFEVKHIPSKRIFDIIFSICGILISLPIVATAALCIRVTSKGPAFFSHPRVGRGGHPFACYKLRTMYFDAEERLKELLANDLQASKEWAEHHKLKHDPRITPLGKFLRKTSIDELPQFWNVLFGDLSIVGPRPVVQTEVARFLRHRAPDILSVRPGLTCTWQVSGRSDLNRTRRMAMDMHYVRNQSLALDVALIARTIPAMFESRGAY